jgi:8-amino-7-oxononanoate synthase
MYFCGRAHYVNHSVMDDQQAWISQELERLSEQGLRRRRRVVTPLPNAWCIAEGRRLRNFSANDYLDLARDCRVTAAAAQALSAAGAGAGASALVSGRTEWHAALEERLALFENQPAALLFPSGFAANVGTICALVGRGDVVLSDRLNHASLIDGSRLSGARIEIYDHSEPGSLEQALRRQQGSRRTLIVTDSVFSMDGDLASLPEICDLAERHGAMVVVDEAHATGVFGAAGRGVCELQGVEHRVTARVGTLSKAIGSIGGFVVGSQDLIDWLWNKARPQIFSTALPPSSCAAAIAALDIIAAEPERRAHLLQTAAHFREALARQGLSAHREAVAPIVPVILQSPERAMQVARQLEDRGYLVGAIRPPSVPAGTSRLRISLSSAHTTDDVDQLARHLGEILAESGSRRE